MDAPINQARRARVAQATKTPRTAQLSAQVDKTHIEADRAGYRGYELRGTGSRGVLKKPLGRVHRPGMAAIRVKEEKMIHRDRESPKTRQKPHKKPLKKKATR